jgi:predicted nucleotide-binding protein (sugar kinase/HSP70/actin superfamily)
MRKDADFNIEDRIATYYQVSGELEAVFQTWQEYIKAETLTTRLVEVDHRLTPIERNTMSRERRSY